MFCNTHSGVQIILSSAAPPAAPAAAPIAEIVSQQQQSLPIAPIEADFNVAKNPPAPTPSAAYSLANAPTATGPPSDSPSPRNTTCGSAIPRKIAPIMAKSGNIFLCLR